MLGQFIAFKFYKMTKTNLSTKGLMLKSLFQLIFYSLDKYFFTNIV